MNEMGYWFVDLCPQRSLVSWSFHLQCFLNTACEYSDVPSLAAVWRPCIEKLLGIAYQHIGASSTIVRKQASANTGMPNATQRSTVPSFWGWKLQSCGRNQLRGNLCASVLMISQMHWGSWIFILFILVAMPARKNLVMRLPRRWIPSRARFLSLIADIWKLKQSDWVLLPECYPTCWREETSAHDSEFLFAQSSSKFFRHPVAVWIFEIGLVWCFSDI